MCRESTLYMRVFIIIYLRWQTMREGINKYHLFAGRMIRYALPLLHSEGKYIVSMRASKQTRRYDDQKAMACTVEIGTRMEPQRMPNNGKRRSHSLTLYALHFTWVPSLGRGNTLNMFAICITRCIYCICCRAQ